EMLRQGVMPPKEIVRPESSRIAMQGIQPKGIDPEGKSISPVGTTIKNVFPFYSTHYNLGGLPRTAPTEPEDMTQDDLIAVIADIRANSDRIYKDNAEEYSYNTDITRTLQPEWINEARDSIRQQQEMVVENLEEKVRQAPEKASDEFMYQDRSEAEKELDTARKILDDIADPVREEDVKYRIWNPMDYKNYRS